MEPTEQSKAPPRQRKASSMPFIMPDGRPLGAFLTETNHMTTSRYQKKGRGRIKEPKNGWGSASSRPPVSSNTHERAPATRVSRVLTEAEHAELAALEKVGQRRQRRWLNDKLLRDMAPPLTAKDMESLFKPAPFGDTGYVSAFTLAALPEHAPLWELFRSVDSDKQNRVLLKWEEHVKELRAEVKNNKEGGPLLKADSALTAATLALQGWSAVGPRGRKALRRAPRGCAEEIEAPILRLVENNSENEIVLELEDGFQRLLAHSLAKFHSLFAQSRDGPEGKVVVVRKRRVGESLNNKNVVRSQSKSPQRESPARDRDTTTEMSTSPPTATTSPVVTVVVPFDPTAPRFTCVDILWLLDDDGNDGLTAKTLRDSLVHDNGALIMEAPSHVVSPLVAH